MGYFAQKKETSNGILCPKERNFYFPRITHILVPRKIQPWKIRSNWAILMTQLRWQSPKCQILCKWNHIMQGLIPIKSLKYIVLLSTYLLQELLFTVKNLWVFKPKFMIFFSHFGSFLLSGASSSWHISVCPCLSANNLGVSLLLFLGFLLLRIPARNSQTCKWPLAAA